MSEDLVEDPPGSYGHLAAAPAGSADNRVEEVRLIETVRPDGYVLVHNRAGYEFLTPAVQVRRK